MSTKPPHPEPGPEPVSFLTATAALVAIEDAVRAARARPSPTQDSAENGTENGTENGAEQALAALLLLRELRTRLADWEAPLVEAARAGGATWADLARPMGVSSRQAAENRYLRLRPAGTTSPEETGAERVKAVRDRRAADRAVSAWARDHGAALRVLAAQITAASGHPPAAGPALTSLTTALGAADPVGLIAPLTDMRPHLAAAHPDLAGRLDDLTSQTDRLRDDSDQRRA